MVQLIALYRINLFNTGPLELGAQLQAHVWRLVSLLPSPGQDSRQCSSVLLGTGPDPAAGPGPSALHVSDIPRPQLRAPESATLVFLLCCLDEEKGRRKSGRFYSFW